MVRGANPGDRVEVWFTGNRPRQGHSGPASSFTYRLAEDTRNRVLVVANEDYEGVNPTYPASVTSPEVRGRATSTRSRAQGYQRLGLGRVEARACRTTSACSATSSAVVWYLGDNRLTQDPEDELTADRQQRSSQDAAVAERQQYLTLSRPGLPERGRQAGAHR